MDSKYGLTSCALQVQADAELDALFAEYYRHIADWRDRYASIGGWDISVAKAEDLLFINKPRDTVLPTTVPPVVVVPPVVPPDKYPGVPTTGWGRVVRWVLNTKVGSIVFFILFIISAAGYFRDQRLADEKAKENELNKQKQEDEKKQQPVLLRDRAIGVDFFGKDFGDSIAFDDGSHLPREGMVLVKLDWNDYKRNLELLRNDKFKPIETDFPVIAQANSSGFDISGIPVTIRRISDGKLLYKDEVTTPLVRYISPLVEGGYSVRFYDHTQLNVNDVEWAKLFMRVEQPKLPDNWEKLSDEEIRKLGFERLSKEEYEKRYGKPLPEPKKSPEPKKEVKGRPMISDLPP